MDEINEEMARLAIVVLSTTLQRYMKTGERHLKENEKEKCSKCFFFFLSFNGEVKREKV